MMNWWSRDYHMRSHIKHARITGCCPPQGGWKLEVWRERLLNRNSISRLQGIATWRLASWDEMSLNWGWEDSKSLLWEPVNKICATREMANAIWHIGGNYSWQIPIPHLTIKNKKSKIISTRAIACQPVNILQNGPLNNIVVGKELVQILWKHRP